MKKIDKTVLRETGYIAVCCVIFSAFMEALFLIIGKWDLTVLLGNLLGLFAAVGNFFLMGLTIQKAVGYEQKQAADAMKASQSMRMIMLFVVAALGVLLGCFNAVSTIAVLFFPRIAVMLRPLFNKKVQSDDNEA